MQQPQIINQGSYGCIFRPGFTCSQKTSKSTSYITKIQHKDAVSQSENNISNKIKTIPKYNDYFAPIKSSCTISIAKINNQEIQKCEIIEKDKQKQKDVQYESNKIKYVGKNSLEKQFIEKYEIQPKRIFAMTIQTYDYLLTALQKLAALQIIHMDLKENNIICHDTNGNPIIIDFGLSLDTTIPNILNKLTDFSDPYYFPWCLDISFLYYALQEKPETLIEETFITTIIHKFIEINKIKSFLSNNELSRFQQKTNTYYQTFMKKNMKSLIDELIQYKMTWDNYSLAVIYLQILKDIFQDDTMNEPRIQSYRKFLIHIFTALPQERPTPEKTKSDIRESISRIPSIELKKLQTTMSKNKKAKIEKMKQHYLIHSITEEEFDENSHKKPI
jgi:serine/threonine protein kinase